MKRVLAIGCLLSSFSAFAATSQPNTGRARYTPPPAAPRYAAAPAPVVTTITTTTTVAETAPRTIGGYIGTEAFSWTRRGYTSEFKSKSTDSYDYTALTSPASLDFVAFWNRMSLRVNKNFGTSSFVLGKDAATGKDITQSTEGSSYIGVGFLIGTIFEVGGLLDLNRYSSESGDGDTKVETSNSRWAIGPYLVVTIPTGPVDLELVGSFQIRSGLTEIKNKGVTTKTSDISGYQFGADALAIFPVTNVVDLGAGLGFAYQSETNKFPQANAAAAGGTETVESIVKASEIKFRLAHLRFKF